jgi:hypothetical protein
MQMDFIEVLREVEQLEQTRRDLLDEEARAHAAACQRKDNNHNCSCSFSKAREKIGDINAKIRKRHLHITRYTTTTMVQAFSMTILECLYYNEQLKQELEVVGRRIAAQAPLAPMAACGSVTEHTIRNDGNAECQDRAQWLQERIDALKYAMDCTYESNMITID